MRIGLRSGVRSGVAKGDHKLIQLTSNLAQSLRLEPGGRFSNKINRSDGGGEAR